MDGGMLVIISRKSRRATPSNKQQPEVVVEQNFQIESGMSSFQLKFFANNQSRSQAAGRRDGPRWRPDDYVPQHPPTMVVVVMTKNGNEPPNNDDATKEAPLEPMSTLCNTY
jgi:hypothetical protein